MKLSILALSLLAACSLAQAQSNDTLKKVADSGKMVVAYRESSVPFSYLDGTKPIGFSEELTTHVVKAVQDKIGKTITVEHQAVTSANRIPLLQNGTIDLECGSTTNNSLRGKDVAFAINHFYTGTRLVVKKSSKIKNFADLKGKTVASTTGTTNVVVLRKYNQDNKLDMNLVMGKDHSDSFLLVEQDRAVAFGMDDILLFGLVANAKNPADYEVVGDSLQVEPYACMLRKDDPAFKLLVDNTFKDLMTSGAFEKMYNKWFMSPIPPKGMNLNLPMAKELRDNLKAMSDKPAT